MQLLEFDLRNFILSILLLIGGCFSSDKTFHIHDTMIEVDTKIDKFYPELTITADKSNMLNFQLTVVEDSAIVITSKKTLDGVKRAIDKLLAGEKDMGNIPVLIKVTNEMDPAALKLLLPELSNRGAKKISTVGETDN